MAVKMTNLNELIAKEKGWEQPTPPDDFWKVSEPIEVKIARLDKLYPIQKPPDYQHDARLWVGLLCEMKDEGVHLEFTHNHDYIPPKFQWFVYFPNWSRNRGIITASDDPGEAVCRAWLAWKGVVVG